jgi:protein TonB
MFTAHEIDQTDEDAIVRRAPVRDAGYIPIERHGYRPPKSSRIFGSAGTIVVGALIAAGFVATLDHLERPLMVSPPLTMTLLPIASPRPPQPKKADKPRPVQMRPTPVDPPSVAPVAPPPVSLPSMPAPIATPQKVSVDSERPTVDASPSPRPPTPAVPPVQVEASHGPDRWEGRLQARLHRSLRYPGEAKRARQQGTAYVHFRMNRDGHVLSASLERSSGYPALDDAALETVRRADPLPKIPPDRPDEVDLTVPIEFDLEN